MAGSSRNAQNNSHAVYCGPSVLFLGRPSFLNVLLRAATPIFDNLCASVILISGWLAAPPCPRVCRDARCGAVVCGLFLQQCVLCRWCPCPPILLVRRSSVFPPPTAAAAAPVLRRLPALLLLPLLLFLHLHLRPLGC